MGGNKDINGKAQSKERAAARAEALRANLLRRKVQERARAGPEEEKKPGLRRGAGDVTAASLSNLSPPPGSHESCRSCPTDGSARKRWKTA